MSTMRLTPMTIEENAVSLAIRDLTVVLENIRLELSDIRKIVEGYPGPND